MQFQSFLASLALVALTSATAIPTTVERRVVEAPNDLEKRADLGVYVCTDRNFQGHCVHITAQAGVCVPLGSDLDNLISSLGPDQGATCYFFYNPNCDTSAYSQWFVYPGVADLSVNPINGPPGSTKNVEDQFSSYRCVQ